MNGVYSFYSGTPFTIGGDNTLLNQRGGTQTIDLIAPLQRSGTAGRTRSTTTRRRSRSRATSGATRDGTSSAGRACGTSTWVCSAASRWDAIAWSSDATASNVLNHSRWGTPNTDFTDPSFMTIRDVMEPRRVVLGLRFEF